MSDRLFRWAAGWAALVLLYLLFVDILPPAELYAAAIIGGIGVLSRLATARNRPHYVFRLVWLAIYARRLLPGIIVDSYRVLVAHPVAAMRGRSPVSGRFVALPFDTGGGDPESRARRVAVLYGSSITPNAVPIFVDEERKLLILHQLYRGREPGAGDREWPM